MNVDPVCFLNANVFQFLLFFFQLTYCFIVVLMPVYILVLG